MSTINAQTIIDECKRLALDAPDAREDFVSPAATLDAYVKIKTSDFGYAAIINDKKHLLAYADKVRKNARAFGGGLVKEAPTRAKSAWSAGKIRVCKQALEDGDREEFMRMAIDELGGRIIDGVVVYAPEPIDGSAFVTVMTEAGKYAVADFDGSRLDRMQFSQRARAAQYAVEKIGVQAIEPAEAVNVAPEPAPAPELPPVPADIKALSDDQLLGALGVEVPAMPADVAKWVGYLDAHKSKALREKARRINRMMQDADPLHDGIDPRALPKMSEPDFNGLIDDLTDQNDHTRALWARCVRSGWPDLQERAYALLALREKLGGLGSDEVMVAQAIRRDLAAAADQAATVEPVTVAAGSGGEPVASDPPVVEFLTDTAPPVAGFLSKKGYDDMSDELKAVRAVWGSKGVHFFAKVGLCEGWAWEQNGEFFAVAYLGRSSKPWSRNGGTGTVYRFKTREKRLQWIRAAFEQAAYIHTRREASKAERAKIGQSGHKLTVGTVLYTSWGYDQTNIDFYEVVGLVGKTMVQVRKIAQECKPMGYMQDDCIPLPGQYASDAKRCKVRTDGETVNIDGHGASPLPYTEPVPGLKVYRVMSSSSYA